MNCLMKKNLVFMAVAAFVLSACAKENAYDATIAPQYTAEGNVLLFATMPQFEDATKAAIAADGSFSWAVGDEIDVVYTKGGSLDQTYTFSCTNASTGAFEYAGEIADGYTVDRAYYPSGYDGEPSPQHFASLEAAAKGFQMEATVSGGKLQFAHENAMFVVTVKNVPLFAKTVWVNSASVDVTSESGDVDVRIPVIPTADAKLGIRVTDAAWDAASHNDLISKVSEKSNAIEAKNLYNLTALEIGPVILVHITPDGGEGTYYIPKSIHIWEIGVGNVTDWESRPALLSLDENTSYYVMDAAYKNHQVGIRLCSDDGSYGQQTGRVFLDRNIELITRYHDWGLRGKFRIYAHPTTVELTGDVNIKCRQNWEPWTFVTSGEDAGEVMTASSSMPGYYYWDFPEEQSDWSNYQFTFVDVVRNYKTSTYILSNAISQDVVFGFNDFWENETVWSLDYQ